MNLKKNTVKVVEKILNYWNSVIFLVILKVTSEIILIFLGWVLYAPHTSLFFLIYWILGDVIVIRPEIEVVSCLKLLKFDESDSSSKSLDPRVLRSTILLWKCEKLTKNKIWVQMKMRLQKLIEIRTVNYKNKCWWCKCSQKVTE